MHVKGITAAHPHVPEAICGTNAGLAHEAAVAHLTCLGVTTVELLPVHHHVPEPFLGDRGLTNYWGYNTIGYFAPHAGWSAEVRAGRPGGQVTEFRAMVDALHTAGLEVVWAGAFLSGYLLWYRVISRLERICLARPRRAANIFSRSLSHGVGAVRRPTS